MGKNSIIPKLEPRLEPNADFRQDYWDYRVNVLEPTEAAVSKLLRKWKRPAPWGSYKRTLRGMTVHKPIARTSTRIKRLESVEDKIRRHPDLEIFSEGMAAPSFRNMHDTLGARIVTYFLTDLALMHDFIGAQEELEMAQKPKAVLPPGVAEEIGFGDDVDFESPDSGYASIHYRVRLTTQAPGAAENPLFEIQVRTLIEDAWAEVEHLIGYKRESKAADVSRNFVILSKLLGAIDSHFDLLNENMRRAQEVKPKKSTELGPETLPATLLKLDSDLTCVQSEVNGMLRALRSYGIDTVGDLTARADGKIKDIVKLWHRATGRHAETFDVINVITYMRPGMPLEEVVDEAVERGGQWIRRRDSQQLERLLRAISDIGLGPATDVIGKYETGDVEEIVSGWEDATGEAPNTLDVLVALYARARWSKDHAPAEVAEWLGQLLSSGIAAGGPMDDGKPPPVQASKD